MAPRATMQFSVEDAGPCRKKVKVNVPEEMVKREFEKSFSQISKSVSIHGFRPGKAPRALVEKRFGKDIALEVKQLLIDNAFDEALKEHELAPIDDPEMDLDAVEVDRGKPVVFDFVVTVKPEFDLPELKGIEVSVPAIEISNGDVADALKRFQKPKATLAPLEKGAVEAEDVVTLNVTAMSGGTCVLDSAEVRYEVGSKLLGDFITQDLDDALLGTAPGATVSASGYAPPHAINHPLARQALALEVELVDAMRPEFPEVDDAFAKGLDFDSQEELRDSVLKDLENRLAEARDRFIENAALAQLVEQTGIELPRSLVDKEIDDMARRAAYGAQIRGESEADIAKAIAAIRSRPVEESAGNLKAYFILDRIVDTERILVTETEVKEAVAQIAAYYGPLGDHLYAVMRDAGRLTGLRNQLRDKKARGKLRKKVQVDDAPN
ncbi:MAG: trigger factor [Planctomycetota bacterium]